MDPFEPSSKSCYRSGGIHRADHTGRNQGCNCVDPVRPGQVRVFHLRQDPLGPVDPRVLGTQRKTQIESMKIKGHQVHQGFRFDAVQALTTLG